MIDLIMEQLLNKWMMVSCILIILEDQKTNNLIKNLHYQKMKLKY